MKAPLYTASNLLKWDEIVVKPRKSTRITVFRKSDATGARATGQKNDSRKSEGRIFRNVTASYLKNNIKKICLKTPPRCQFAQLARPPIWQVIDRTTTKAGLGRGVLTRMRPGGRFSPRDSSGRAGPRAMPDMKAALCRDH
jgi:hypothetical protein